MKNIFWTLVIGAAVWALPGAGTASAADIQSRNVSVPFAFKVHNMTLPAGQYRVEQSVGKQVVYIVNMQTGHRIPVLRALVNSPTGNAKLTFEKTSTGYKLADIS